MLNQTNMKADLPLRASIVLSDMKRTSHASYGFRSWMLQDFGEQYEVVLCLFNDREHVFSELATAANPHCAVRIQRYRAPPFFNISAANNLGLAASRGEYVFFANSDIVYPSWYLREVLDELSRRSIDYALGSRVNLTQAQTQGLRPPFAYTFSSNFDTLFSGAGRSISNLFSPWIAKRDVAISIGGFDPRVVCHEDAEFNDRMIHYLRRSKRQRCIYIQSDLFSCLFGCHLAHPSSELYVLSPASNTILESRRLRLTADPGSAEDVLPTRFDSEEALLHDLYSTEAPSRMDEIVRLSKAIQRRVQGAAHYLLHGRIT